MDYNGDKSTSHTTNTQLTCKEATCQFFGSAQTEGYCSVCYKAIIAKKNAQPAADFTPASTTTPQHKQQEVKDIIPEDEDMSTHNDKIDTEIQSSSNPVISSKIDDTICSTVKNSVSSVNDSIEKSTTSVTTESVSNEAPKLESSTLHQNQNTPQIPTSTSKSTTTTPIPATPSSTITEKSETESKSDTPKKAKKRRCGVCKKKIGLTGFECRCGGLFCSMHRYADVHSCTFDYKVDGREKIRKANPVVQDDKINRF